MTSFASPYGQHALAPYGDAATQEPAELVGKDSCYPTAEVASSRLITNAATKERLTLAGWVPARRGADDFLRHASKGTLC